MLCMETKTTRVTNRKKIQNGMMKKINQLIIKQFRTDISLKLVDKALKQ